MSIKKETIVTTFGDRLKKNFPQKLTQQALADKLGVSIGAVKKWLRGDSAPSFELIKPLSEILNKSVEWVLTGEDAEIDTIVSESATQSKKNKYNIDVYDVEMAAGSGTVNYEEEIIDRYQLSKNFFNKHSLVPNNTAGVFVKGDSMEPKFFNGDIVIIDTSINTFETDGIYAFCYEKYCFIKHLQLVGNKLYAISTNKAYEKWLVETTEEFKIIGMVKAAICRI